MVVCVREARPDGVVPGDETRTARRDNDNNVHSGAVGGCGRGVRREMKWRVQRKASNMARKGKEFDG